MKENNRTSKAISKFAFALLALISIKTYADSDIANLPTGTIITMEVNELVPAGSDQIELFDIYKHSDKYNFRDSHLNYSFFHCYLHLISKTPRDYTLVGKFKATIENIEKSTKTNRFERYDDSDLVAIDTLAAYFIHSKQFSLNGSPVQSIDSLVCWAEQNNGNVSTGIIRLLYLVSVMTNRQIHETIFKDEFRDQLKLKGGDLFVPTEQLP